MEIGISHTSHGEVSPQLSAQNMGSGDMPVLATPAMMALMENAAMLCVAPYLPEGSTTVGSQIESSHERPTPLQASFQATATLKAVEGRKLTFEVVASDAKGIIGRGTHTRYIVDRERFLGKL